MVDVNRNFIKAEFIDKVKLHPKYLDKNIDNSILNVLRKSKEGLCTNHGYIKKNSIKLKKIDNGNVDLTSFHGYVMFQVKYEALVCNPVKDNIVNAKIINVNNFGILCHSSMIENGEEIPILEIIVPKQSLSIQSEVDLTDTELIIPGKMVMVKIVGKKYQLNNKKISIIGTIVNTDSTEIMLDEDDIRRLPTLETLDDAISLEGSVEDEGDESDVEIMDEFEENNTSDKVEVEVEEDSDMSDDEIEEAGDEDDEAEEEDYEI